MIFTHTHTHTQSASFPELHKHPATDKEAEMLVSLCLMCNHSLKMTTMVDQAPEKNKTKQNKTHTQKKHDSTRRKTSRTPTSSARLKLERWRGRACGESSLEGRAGAKLDWLAGQAPLPGR